MGLALLLAWVGLFGCASAHPPAQADASSAVAACLARPEAAAYAEAVKRQVARTWQVPAGAAESGEVTVLLSIDPSGALRLAIAPRAGRPGLEESALAAVRAAAPFPPMQGPAACLGDLQFRAVFRPQPARS
jgi:TonB family protein